MTLTKLSPSLFVTFLFLAIPVYTYAQDAISTSNDNHRLEVGLGVQYLDRNIMEKRQLFNSVLFELSINYSYRLADFYRMGVENRFGNFVYFCSDALLYMHEFDILHSGKFTFSARAGIGLSWYYVDGRTDDIDHYPNKHKIAVPLDFGLGFDWRQSDFISVRIALGITDNIIFYTYHNNAVARHYPAEKDDHSFKNGIGANLSIRVGFHF